MKTNLAMRILPLAALLVFSYSIATAGTFSLNAAAQAQYSAGPASIPFAWDGTQYIYSQTPYVSDNKQTNSPAQSVTSYSEGPLAVGGSTTYYYGDSPSSPYGKATDSASASVLLFSFSNGEMHAATTASGSKGVYSRGGDNATASTQMIWLDYLNIGGLPQGTPVDLSITAVLDALVSGSGQYNGNTGAVLSAQVADKNSGASIDFFQSEGTGNSGKWQDSKVLHTISGDRLYLEFELNTVAEGLNTFTATTNASDTGFLHIDTVTNGATTITSDSGIDYTKTGASMPEPSSFVLLGCGLVLFVTLTKSQSSSRRCVL